MFRERCKDYTSQIDFQGRHLNIIEEKHALMQSNLPEEHWLFMVSNYALVSGLFTLSVITCT